MCLEPCDLRAASSIPVPIADEENLFNPFAMDDEQDSDLCDPIVKYQTRGRLAATQSLPGRVLHQFEKRPIVEDNMFEPIFDFDSPPIEDYSPDVFYREVLSRKFVDPEDFTSQHFSEEEERMVTPPDTQLSRGRLVDLEVGWAELTSMSNESPAPPPEGKPIEVGRFVITRKPFIRACQSDLRCCAMERKRKQLKSGFVQIITGRITK